MRPNHAWDASTHSYPINSTRHVPHVHVYTKCSQVALGPYHTVVSSNSINSFRVWVMNYCQTNLYYTCFYVVIQTKVTSFYLLSSSLSLRQDWIPLCFLFVFLKLPNFWCIHVLTHHLRSKPTVAIMLATSLRTGVPIFSNLSICWMTVITKRLQ